VLGQGYDADVCDGGQFLSAVLLKELSVPRRGILRSHAPPTAGPGRWAAPAKGVCLRICGTHFCRVERVGRVSRLGRISRVSLVSVTSRSHRIISMRGFVGLLIIMRVQMHLC
jgi:hypothetical protein